MENNEIITNIIDAFFYGATPIELVKRCPNHMLWEAIKGEDAVLIEKQDVLAYLLQKDAFFAMSEPIPAIRNGVEPEYTRIKCSDLLWNDKEYFWELFNQEPTYLVSCDYKWMIALTTENTSHGTQLCALVLGQKT